MRRTVALLRAAWLLPCALSAPALAATEPAARCPAISIDSREASEHDRELVYVGAAKAREFLHAHGIRVRRGIRLKLHGQRMPLGPSHIGLYSAETDQIELLSYAQARRQTTDNPLFGLPMTPALYESVVVHEVSHAIVEQNLSTRLTSRVVHEYIAYAAQLSSMAPDLRREILRRYGQPAFADVDEMSWVYYELDPSGFGVKVYRHFLALRDPAAFLQDLLSGAVRPVAERREGM